MNDKENPPLMDELKDIHKQIESKMPNIVQTIGHNHGLIENTVKKSSISIAHGQIENTNFQVPNLAKSFNLPHIDIPDLDTSLPDIKPIPTKTLS